MMMGLPLGASLSNLFGLVHSFSATRNGRSPLVPGQSSLGHQTIKNAGKSLDRLAR